MNIDDLQDFLLRENVGSVTISAAATGRIYATATVRGPKTPFASVGRYGDTVPEALVELELAADAAPAVKPATKAPVVSEDDDLLGDLL